MVIKVLVGVASSGGQERCMETSTLRLLVLLSRLTLYAGPPVNTQVCIDTTERSFSGPYGSYGMAVYKMAQSAAIGSVAIPDDRFD